MNVTLWIKTLVTWVPEVGGTGLVDVYPAGVSWTPSAKYQIWRGQLGYITVMSKTPPYIPVNGNAGYPMAFATLQEAEAAFANTAGSTPTVTGYRFWGRDPQKEMAQSISAYNKNSEEFAEADTKITAYLASRGATSANTIFNYYASKLVNQDSNNQYVLGLNASSGGGQNTTYLANSLSVMQLQDAADKSLNFSAQIPIVVPFESPLVSDAHASAVEAKNAGEIRDQQLRQSIASAGGMYQGYNIGVGQNQSWEGMSILMGAYGQAAAASAT
jgi:hypothetical protein